MFLVCGEALYDFFGAPVQTGAIEQQRAYKAIAGGSPFNVAVGLSRLGVEAALLTGLSTDPLGQQLRQVLEMEGVCTRYLVPVEAQTTLSLVSLNDNGSPQYSFYGESGADRQLRLADIPALDDSITGLHLGSYSIAVSPIAQTLLALVEQVSHRLLITLDPNIRLNVEPDIGIWRERIDALSRHAHLIKVSEEDLELLYEDRAPEEVARSWLGDQCQLVVLTRGGQGVSVFTRELGEWSCPARALVAVDTVGAGDSFQAALIAFLVTHGFDSPASIAALNRQQINAMLAYATQAAAHTCLRQGADLPRRHHLEQHVFSATAQVAP